MRVEKSGPTTAGPQEPGPYLRGVLPEQSWAEASRLHEASSRKLPGDTVRAARVPAGVHLALTGTARAVELAVQVGEPTSVPAPTVAEVFLARAARAPAVAVPVPATGGVRVPLPERHPDEVVRIHLPETVEVRIDSVTPIGGGIAPAPRGPRWVVYGDSIAQGWSVGEAGLGWPSLVAEQLGLDLVNLGFAGAARGELPGADLVGGSGAEAVAIAWGTNAWSSLPTDAAAVRETMRLFLTTVRQGLPSAPVVVVSPIVRPDAEHTPNRFGATLADLRTALEAAAHGVAAATDDERITVVPGHELVPAELLADGIHPGDAGHRRLAAGVVPHVAAGLATLLRPGA